MVSYNSDCFFPTMQISAPQFLHQTQNNFLWYIFNSACISFHSHLPPIPTLNNCLGTCFLWCCPCPCSQQSPLLTGYLMEYRSHMAGCVHTDVFPLVLSCPMPVTRTSAVYAMLLCRFLPSFCSKSCAVIPLTSFQFLILSAFVLCNNQSAPAHTKNVAVMSAFKALFCPASHCF